MEEFGEIKGRKRNIAGRVLKICLLSFAGVWLILCICLQIALNSSRVKSAVLDVASDFVDGRISLGKLKGEAFRHFPDITISLEDLAVTGPGEKGDTLAGAGCLEARLRVPSLLKGRIRIPYIGIRDLRANAIVYDNDTANWDMIILPESDSNSTLPHVVFNTIELKGNNRLAYMSLPDGTEAVARTGHMVFNGKIDIADPFRHGGKASLDAMAELSYDSPATEKAELPLTLFAQAAFPAKNSRLLDLRTLDVDAGVLGMNGKGEFSFAGDSTLVRAELSANSHRIQEAIDKYALSFLPGLKELDTDAGAELILMADGWLIPSKNVFPQFLAQLLVPESSFSYGRFRGGRITADIGAEGDICGNINIDVDKLSARVPGVSIDFTGGAEDVLCEDPLLNVSLEASVELDRFSDMLPEGMSAKGDLLAAVSGYTFLSDLDLYNFGKGDLDGFLLSDAIEFKDGPDSISVFLDKTEISLSREENEMLMLGFTGSIDTLSAGIGSYAYIKAKDIGLSLHNAAGAIETEYGKEHHALLGKVNVRGLDMFGTDSLSLKIKDSRNGFRYSDLSGKDAEPRPVLAMSSENGDITVKQGVNRAGVFGLTFDASAAKRELRQARERSRKRDSLRTREPVPTEDDFSKDDLDLSLGGSVSSFIRDWSFNGNLAIDNGTLLTPYFPLRNKAEDIRGKFSDKEIRLDNLTLRSGGSDVSMKGKISGMRRAAAGRGPLNLDLDIVSELLKTDELLSAYSAGIIFAGEGSKKEFSQDMSDEQYLKELMMEEEQDNTSSLIVIPANVNANIRLVGNDIDYNELCIDWFDAEIAMKNRTLQITNTVATSNMGDIYFEGFYATRSKKDISVGFDLNMASITTDKVISLFPAVDSLMPMLKSFKGNLDCEIAATSQLDTNMNIVFPSANGVMNIKGTGLSLEGNEALDKLAKVLLFKDRKMGHIDDMTVQGVIKDNVLEVFPFVMKVDRYTLAMNGLQNFDQSFKYHVSVLKSPIPFRFGINLSGNFDDWKYKIGKAKYKNVNVPVFTRELKDMKMNLVQSIHDIFAKGVVNAMSQNEASIGSINLVKEASGYDSSAESEDMDDEELAKFNSIINEDQHTGIHRGNSEASNVD